MSEQIKSIVGYIVIFVILFFTLSKGIDWWVQHKMIKEDDERIAFAIKNNDADKCAVISSAIRTANTLTDQKARDRYKAISQENNCSSPNDIDPVAAAAFAEQQGS